MSLKNRMREKDGESRERKKKKSETQINQFTKSSKYTPLLLAHATVNGADWKVLLLQELAKHTHAGLGAEEDDDLVELKGIEQVKQLAGLFLLGELGVVLLEAAQLQLGIIIDAHLHGLQRNRNKGKRKKKNKPTDKRKLMRKPLPPPAAWRKKHTHTYTHTLAHAYKIVDYSGLRCS